MRPGSCCFSSLILFSDDRFDLNYMDPPIRTSKERKEGAQEVSKYLEVLTPDEREMPGFEGKLGKWDRHRSVQSPVWRLDLFFSDTGLTVTRCSRGYTLATEPL